MAVEFSFVTILLNVQLCSLLYFLIWSQKWEDEIYLCFLLLWVLRDLFVHLSALFKIVFMSPISIYGHPLSSHLAIRGRRNF